MKKSKLIKLKLIKNGCSFSIITLFLLSCNGAENKIITAADLPIFGNRDIAYEKSDKYNIGDTIFHEVPNWKYLTQDSILLSSSEVEDKIWIANFFFSYCPTICVPMNKELNKVNQQLNDYEDDIAFLSFSIDPDRDTPARLKEYRKKLNFNAKNWHFLTGDKDDIYDLAYHGFQLLAQEDESAPGGFIHSSNFILVDKNKHIRGIYDSSNEDNCKQLIEDVKLLLSRQ